MGTKSSAILASSEASWCARDPSLARLAALCKLFSVATSLFTSLCEKTRGEAFDLMLEHAQQLGANAVIGICYDATEIMSGVTEVLCYGTAVIVERSV